jgi:hypothetical protein
MSNLAVLKLALSSQESLILIMNDMLAKKVAVAWKIYRPAFKETTGKSGEDIHASIDRLWEGVGPINFDRLAQIAGQPVTHVTKAFLRLRAANLIWPDGTISDETRKIILGDVGGYAGVLAKQASALRPKTEKGKTDDGNRPDAKAKKTAGKNRGRNPVPKTRNAKS